MAPFCSAEQSHFSNFRRGSSKEHFCENILKSTHWPWRRGRLKGFSIFSSDGHFVQQSGPSRVAQLVGHLILSQGSWLRYPVWQHSFVSPSAFSKRAVVSYWRKYVHKVLVNRLGGLSLPRKSVVRLTDCPDMTLYVYRGRKTTMQQKSAERNHFSNFG